MYASTKREDNILKCQKIEGKHVIFLQIIKKKIFSLELIYNIWFVSICIHFKKS